MGLYELESPIPSRESREGLDWDVWLIPSPFLAFLVIEVGEAVWSPRSGGANRVGLGSYPS